MLLPAVKVFAKSLEGTPTPEPAQCHHPRAASETFGAQMEFCRDMEAHMESAEMSLMQKQMFGSAR